MNGSDPKQIARELLEEAHSALIGLSHWIHANPELGYQEFLASGWVKDWLTAAGFEVRTGVAGMPTAIVGSFGPGPFHLAVCVEYDALPAVGHACGHNVIAAAGVGAGLALAAVAEQLGLRVTVMGTPAEETGGGKVGLIQAGEFEGVHAAMMVHPWPQDEAAPRILAIRSLNVTYTGREAHAAGFPYLGVNAADALVVAQTAIALLRQQLRSTDRVHGIVTKGGDAANIIPSHTEAHWMVRGTDVGRLDEVTALVRRCFEAGALATGATLQVEEEICYADVRHHPELAHLYQANAEQLGRTFSDPGMPVSTDMGNVSYVVPTIHPMIGIAADGAVNHQAAFAAACATPSADQAIFDGALAMAWTGIDAALDDDLRARLMDARPVETEVAMVSATWKMPPGGAPGVAATAVAPIVAVATKTGEMAPEPTIAEDAATAMAEADHDLVAVTDAWGVMAPEPAVNEAASATDASPDAPPGADASPDASPADMSPVADAPPGADASPDASPADMSPVADAPPGPDGSSDPVPPADATGDYDPDAAWAADVDAVAQAIAGAGQAPADEDAEAVWAAAAVVEELETAIEPEIPVEVEEPMVAASAPLADQLVADADRLPSGSPEPAAEPSWPAIAEDPEAGSGAWGVPEASVPPPAAESTWFATDAGDVAADAERPASPEPSRWERDAWDHAFEEAASRTSTSHRDEPPGGDSQGGLSFSGDAHSAAEVGLPPGWPPAGDERISREHIEAEGFSFVAPEVAAHGEELSDPWSRNGADHANEDLRLR